MSVVITVSCMLIGENMLLYRWLLLLHFFSELLLKSYSQVDKVLHAFGSRKNADKSVEQLQQTRSWALWWIRMYLYVISRKCYDVTQQWLLENTSERETAFAL